MPVFAPTVEIVVVNGNAAMITGAGHASLPGPVILALATMSIPLTVCPAAIAMATEPLALSGGLVLDSLAPFQNSAGPGNPTGGSKGPTASLPVNDESIASVSTV